MLEYGKNDLFNLDNFIEKIVLGRAWGQFVFLITESFITLKVQLSLSFLYLQDNVLSTESNLRISF